MDEKPKKWFAAEREDGTCEVWQVNHPFLNLRLFNVENRDEAERVCSSHNKKLDRLESELK